VNAAIYHAALAAGCPRREAEVLALYVESESARSVARQLGIATTTVTNHLGHAQRRLGVKHTSAVIARLTVPTPE
jgi:DNA-binding CsgD family transcriptional regulator